MLQNPSVVRWLDGIEPAWTLLDHDSFGALRLHSRPPGGAIRLAADFSPEDVARSPVARNALILLHSASTGPGLKMTATGNLTRNVVAEMCDLFSWPHFDKRTAFRFHKVINEPDFLPLHFVRSVTQAAGLVRRHKGYLRASRAGRAVLEDPDRRALQALLFQSALWDIDLQYLGMGLHLGWPQRDVGLVLWSLSVAANDWQSCHRLTRLCTLPINGVLESQWDSGSFAMEARILQPLLWFGLVEHRQRGSRQDESQHSNQYRKTALFDRFLSFDVNLEHGASRHH